MKISGLFKELYPSLKEEQAKGLEKICLEITGKEFVGDKIVGQMRKAKRLMNKLGINEVVI